MSVHKILYWTPRALSLAFALFLAVFALDVFSEGFTFWKTLAALAVHLIPTFLVLAVLVVAWRWEWFGAAGFVALGGLYAASKSRHPSWILLISGPLFVIALLFFLLSLI
jgi:hypothetical protein